MKNTNFKVGVVVPPDSYYKPVLYSHVKATKDFQILNQDLYEAKQKAKRIDEKKTPTSVYVTLGLAGVGAACVGVKNLFKKKKVKV